MRFGACAVMMKDGEIVSWLFAAFSWPYQRAARDDVGELLLFVVVRLFRVLSLL